MSITIHKQPDSLSPCYNPMIIAVTGSNQTSSNYQFVATLFVNGEQASRLKIPVNPEGYGVFDIHRHIENQITYDFHPEWNGWNIATNSHATYSVTFAEEFRYEWDFLDNFFASGGYVGFVGVTGGDEPLFNVDDTIVVTQDGTPTNPQYDGNSIITGITLSGSNWLITTNKSFGSSTPPEPGTIVLSNYQLTTVAATESISEQYAWNGVYSFLDFINYDYTYFVPATGSSYGNWMTSMPDNWEVGTSSRALFLTYREDLSQAQDLIVESNNGIYTLDSSSLISYGPQVNINTYANNGGNVRFDCSSAHGLSLGDTFQVFQSPYNGIYQVIQVNSSTAVTGNVTYTGSGAFGAEYLKKINNPEGNRFRMVGVGPYELITYTASFDPGTYSFPIIDANTTTYSVYTKNSDGDQDINAKVFKIKDLCSRYEKIQLIFLDKLGSFIPFTFNRVSRENRTIEKSKYKQFYGEYAPASNSWNYNAWDRGTTTLDVRVTENYTVISDWVNQTTSDFLMELFESPEVYWVKENGTTVAITITNNTVERKQTINDQIINYTLTFEVAQKSMNQKG